MKTIQLLVLASALLPVPVFATERLEFSEIWKRVKVESPEVRPRSFFRESVRDR